MTITSIRNKFNRLLDDRLREALEPSGYTIQQWMVMSALSKVKTSAGKAAGANAGEVSESTGIMKPSLSRIFNTLVSEGVVRRVADPGDRRNLSLSLTAKGRGVLKKYVKAFAKAEIISKYDFRQYHKDIKRYLGA